MCFGTGGATASKFRLRAVELVECPLAIIGSGESDTGHRASAGGIDWCTRLLGGFGGAQRNLRRLLGVSGAHQNGGAGPSSDIFTSFRFT